MDVLRLAGSAITVDLSETTTKSDAVMVVMMETATSIRRLRGMAISVSGQGRKTVLLDLAITAETAITTALNQCLGRNG
jgi:hypothetical protein